MFSDVEIDQPVLRMTQQFVTVNLGIVRSYEVIRTILGKREHADPYRGEEHLDVSDEHEVRYRVVISKLACGHEIRQEFGLAERLPHLGRLFCAQCWSRARS